MTGELFAIFAVLTFVVSNILFRKTEHEASPSFINFFRTGIGTLTFIILALVFEVFFHIFLLPLTLWFILILSFIFGQVIGDTSYLKAQKELGTAKALSISMTFPLFTFIISMIFLDYPFDIRIIISILLIGIGVVIIATSKINLEDVNVSNVDQTSVSKDFNNFEINSRTFSPTVIFGLIASLGWAIGAVLIEYALNEIDRILQIEAFSSIIGNVIRFPFIFLILALIIWREEHIQTKIKSSHRKNKSTQMWYWLIIGSIIGTSIGAFLYTEAVRTAGATFIAIIASASPLFALPLDYLINGEKISKKGFLGVILTIVGVIVILL